MPEIVKKKRKKKSREARRRDYLHRIKQEYGELKCEYCGRNDLIVTKSNREFKDRMATIDHIEPRNGGKTGSKKTARGPKINWAIACPECNNAKDNLSMEEFIEIKEKIIMPWDQKIYLQKNDPEQLKKIMSEIRKNRKALKIIRHPHLARPARIQYERTIVEKVFFFIARCLKVRLA